MGASKTNYSAKLNRMAYIAKALGHPARIAIIEHLLNEKDIRCDDLVCVLPISQPTISQHLRELQLSGLIIGNYQNQNYYYRLNRYTVEILRNYLSHFIDKK